MKKGHQPEGRHPKDRKTLPLLNSIAGVGTTLTLPLQVPMQRYGLFTRYEPCENMLYNILLIN